MEKNFADLLTNYRWFRVTDKQLVIPRAARLMLEVLRIHPFANGNGRVARYLGNLMLVVNGIDPKIYDKPRWSAAFDGSFDTWQSNMEGYLLDISTGTVAVNAMDEYHTVSFIDPVPVPFSVRSHLAAFSSGTRTT